MTIGAGAARVFVARGIRRGDVIDVRALVEPPMATGLFRDARGNPIPAYFINDVSVTYGDREAAHFVWSCGISRDPFVEFSLRADREAALKFVWKDNKGGVFQQSVDIRRLYRSEEHTSELQSRLHLVCRLLLEKKKNKNCRCSYTYIIR